MTTELRIAFESLLYDYCCGELTAKQVQKELNQVGYKADLRGNSHIIDVLHVDSGEWYPIHT